jgi:hypothetical protein
MTLIQTHINAPMTGDLKMKGNDPKMIKVMSRSRMDGSLQSCVLDGTH